MRGFLVKFASVLTALFYLFAIGGFDVHSDHESGQIYVRLLSAGISCEDVHPDSPCHHNHSDGCEEEEDCCSDDILVLSVTGNDSASDEFLPVPSVSFCLEAACVSRVAEQALRTDRPSLCQQREVPPKLLLHRICIMRV